MQFVNISNQALGTFDIIQNQDLIGILEEAWTFWQYSKTKGWVFWQYFKIDAFWQYL